MAERLYTEHPKLYDAIQSDWDYDRDVAFVEATLSNRGVEGGRVLEIGCGTGEHTRRLDARGFDVTAIDKHQGMLDVAMTKCEVDFRRESLPDLSIDETFDVAVAIRGVLNHLSPEELTPGLRAIKSRLTDDGIFIFDNSPLPSEGNHPGIDIGTTESGEYARIAQHVPTGDGRLDWRSITFTSDGEFFTNSRLMTPFDDTTIAQHLERTGFSVETHDGFGPNDSRTVFVATA
ncbi:MAG: class I SAM-dependent methyltransferase [Halobacteriaceae archaeon]